MLLRQHKDCPRGYKADSYRQFRKIKIDGFFTLSFSAFLLNSNTMIISDLKRGF